MLKIIINVPIFEQCSTLVSGSVLYPYTYNIGYKLHVMTSCFLFF